MEFNQFVDEVKGRIKQFLPIEYEDAQVRIEEVKKLNENYLGITVLKENQVIAPTFNLNQLYKMYQSDPEVSMGSILRSITELVLDVPEILDSIPFYKENKLVQEALKRVEQYIEEKSLNVEKTRPKEEKGEIQKTKSQKRREDMSL